MQAILVMTNGEQMDDRVEAGGYWRVRGYVIWALQCEPASQFLRFADTS
jgi:hypothetical protein